MAPSRGAKRVGSRKSHSISYGRPPLLKKTANRSSTAARTIIRTHHQLQKARAVAVADGNEKLVTELENEILVRGGLKVYQEASIVGQSASRGGDSSKILVEWSQKLQPKTSLAVGSRPKLLEVGALSTTNACSTSGIFAVTRIDLHSQGPGIMQQDFMKRPLPKNDDERFDAISLSLVLNYVPDAIGRGEMLKRTRSFLRSEAINSNSGRTTNSSQVGNRIQSFPLLFLVLPGPCVTNSRYMNQKRFREIMESLGYILVFEKLSSKLSYSLWKLDCTQKKGIRLFPKTEVNPGKGRNNFSIVI